MRRRTTLLLTIALVAIAAVALLLAPAALAAAGGGSAGFSGGRRWRRRRRRRRRPRASRSSSSSGCCSTSRCSATEWRDRARRTRRGIRVRPDFCRRRFRAWAFAGAPPAGPRPPARDPQARAAGRAGRGRSGRRGPDVRPRARPRPRPQRCSREIQFAWGADDRIALRRPRRPASCSRSGSAGSTSSSARVGTTASNRSRSPEVEYVGHRAAAATARRRPGHRQDRGAAARLRGRLERAPHQAQRPVHRVGPAARVLDAAAPRRALDPGLDRAGSRGRARARGDARPDRLVRRAGADATKRSSSRRLQDAAPDGVKLAELVNVDFRERTRARRRSTCRSPTAASRRTCSRSRHGGPCRPGLRRSTARRAASANCRAARRSRSCCTRATRAGAPDWSCADQVSARSRIVGARSGRRPGDDDDRRRPRAAGATSRTATRPRCWLAIRLAPRRSPNAGRLPSPAMPSEPWRIVAVQRRPFPPESARVAGGKLHGSRRSRTSGVPPRPHRAAPPVPPSRSDDEAGDRAEPEPGARAEAAITAPTIGPPIGVEPWNETNHSDITRPRISGAEPQLQGRVADRHERHARAADEASATSSTARSGASVASTHRDAEAERRRAPAAAVPVRAAGRRSTRPPTTAPIPIAAVMKPKPLEPACRPWDAMYGQRHLELVGQAADQRPSSPAAPPARASRPM